jgi:hypothetical protein
MATYGPKKLYDDLVAHRRIIPVKTASGENAQTACLGFGLERCVTALFKTHGMVPSEWPTAVRDRLWPKTA